MASTASWLSTQSKLLKRHNKCISEEIQAKRNFFQLLIKYTYIALESFWYITANELRMHFELRMLMNYACITQLKSCLVQGRIYCKLQLPFTLNLGILQKTAIPTIIGFDKWDPKTHGGTDLTQNRGQIWVQHVLLNMQQYQNLSLSFLKIFGVSAL